MKECSICGKILKSLGYARHMAMHREEKEKKKALEAENAKLKEEYNWKKATLADSNKQLEDAIKELEAKSLVIVDMGCDRERLDNHLEARIAQLGGQINDPDMMNTNKPVTELKIYQEIKKLME